MEVLRTPDERFAGLPDYPFAPHYVELSTDDGTALRVHYLDEGPPEAAPVVLLHGNPTWSYLYRHLVTGLVARGHRVLACDLVGMGRSDKPTDPDFFTLARHVDWMVQWFEAVDLSGATMFCHDWGGIIGLNALAVQPERVDRVVAANTGLPAGEGVNPFMERWLAFSQSVDELPVGALVDGGSSRSLSPGERAAYDAPFPDARYQAGARRFPLLIPLQPDNPGVPQCRATWRFLEGWHKPFLTVFGSEDQIAFKPGSHRKLQRVIPGTRGLDHVVIDGANHFIQEDAADRLVGIVDDFARSARP